MEEKKRLKLVDLNAWVFNRKEDRWIFNFDNERNRELKNHNGGYNQRLSHIEYDERTNSTVVMYYVGLNFNEDKVNRVLKHRLNKIIRINRSIVIARNEFANCKKITSEFNIFFVHPRLTNEEIAAIDLMLSEIANEFEDGGQYITERRQSVYLKVERDKRISGERVRKDSMSKADRREYNVAYRRKKKMEKVEALGMSEEEYDKIVMMRRRHLGSVK